MEHLLGICPCDVNDLDSRERLIGPIGHSHAVRHEEHVVRAERHSPSVAQLDDSTTRNVDDERVVFRGDPPV